METAIISGKGGTGKSSVAAAFATLAKEVVLADCDVDAANLYILFQPKNPDFQAFTGSREAVVDVVVCDGCGLCVEFCRFDALSMANGHVTVSGVFCDGCGLCARVCPHNAIVMKENKESVLCSADFRYGQLVYGRLAPGEENSGKLVSLVRERARQNARDRKINTVIIDGPPGIGCPVIASITGVDQVVIVTEPSMSGMLDLKRIWSLCKSFGLPTWVLINKYDLHSAQSEEIETFCTVNGIRFAGKLSFDSIIVDAMVHCKTVAEWVPGADIVTEIKTAYNKIFQRGR